VHFAGRTVTTLHGRLDQPHAIPFYHVFRDLPLVAVSGDQRKYLRSANWIGTVHHGLPSGPFPFQPKASDGYLAFLGRIAPEKRPDRAIDIAVRTGMPLKIAAKVDRVDQAYWDEKIRPMVEANASVEYLGEIAEHEKGDYAFASSQIYFFVTNRVFSKKHFLFVRYTGANLLKLSSDHEGSSIKRLVLSMLSKIDTLTIGYPFLISNAAD
jgi:hypothetical protein